MWCDRHNKAAIYPPPKTERKENIMLLDQLYDLALFYCLFVFLFILPMAIIETIQDFKKRKEKKRNANIYRCVQHRFSGCICKTY